MACSPMAGIFFSGGWEHVPPTSLFEQAEPLNLSGGKPSGFSQGISVEGPLCLQPS